MSKQNLFRLHWFTPKRPSIEKPLFPSPIISNIHNNNRPYSSIKQHRKLSNTTSTIHEPELSPTNTPKPLISISIKTDLDNSLIPDYLHSTYWWAYTNENAVKFWERQWLVDAILWGNFKMLRDEALKEITDERSSGSRRNVLQIACVYGNFTQEMCRRLVSSGERESVLRVVDIAPVQLENIKSKLTQDLERDGGKGRLDVELYQLDSSVISEHCAFGEGSQELIYVFFLLHELPLSVRVKTIAETLKLVKPGGKVVFMDYHKPVSKWNPFRYMMYPVLTVLEPFAIDMWRHEIEEWIPESGDVLKEFEVEKKVYFGGLYQKLVLTKKIF